MSAYIPNIKIDTPIFNYLNTTTNTTNTTVWQNTPNLAKSDTVETQAPIPKLTTESFHGPETFIVGTINKLVNSYPTVEDIGINPENATSAQVQLARIGSEVAKDLDSKGYCYSGVKHTMWTSGLIEDYEDMPGGSATNANEYFTKHQDIYTELKDIKPEQIKELPAGTIVVFSQKGTKGHIGIANGNGQLYSDCTDDSSWYDYKGGKEKGASYKVYQLNDNVIVNKKTGKLEIKKD